MTRRAPASSAADDQLARCRRSTPPRDRCRRPHRPARAPTPAAISMTAVRPSSRQAASTGSPSGPVTVVVRLGPPSASRVPSPPSAIGTSSQSHPSSNGGVADRLGDLGRGRGAAELVGSGDHAHAAMLACTVPARRPVPVDTVGPPMAPRSPRPADRPRLQPRPGVLRARGRRRAHQQAGRRRAGVRASGRSPPTATSPGWPPPCPTTIERRPAPGVVEADGFRVRLLALDPETYRLAYDVVSNEVLWFAHHGLWDLTREPAFDAVVARRVGRLPRGEPRLRRRGGRGGARGAAVLVQDYHLCLVAARLRATRARPRVRALPPHAVRPARVARRPARRGGAASCSRAWPPTAPAASTASGGPTTSAASARALADLEPTDVRVAARLRPRRHPRRGRLARVRRGAGRARRASCGPRRDRTGRPRRAVEEHPARVPGLRRAPRDAPGAPRAGRVRRQRLRQSRTGVPGLRRLPRAASSTRSAPSTSGSAPTAGSRSCSTSRTTSRGRSPCSAAPTCCS